MKSILNASPAVCCSSTVYVGLTHYIVLAHYDWISNPVINMSFITVEKDDVWITLLDMWQSVSFKQYSFINVLMDSSQLTIMLHVVWCHLVGECA